MEWIWLQYDGMLHENEKVKQTNNSATYKIRIQILQMSFQKTMFSPTYIFILHSLVTQILFINEKCASINVQCFEIKFIKTFFLALTSSSPHENATFLQRQNMLCLHFPFVPLIVRSSCSLFCTLRELPPADRYFIFLFSLAQRFDMMVLYSSKISLLLIMIQKRHGVGDVI